MLMSRDYFENAMVGVVVAFVGTGLLFLVVGVVELVRWLAGVL